MVEGFDAAVRVILTALLNGFWQGLVLSGIVLAGLQVAVIKKKINAASRYAVLFVTLSTVVFLPVIVTLPVLFAPVQTQLIENAETSELSRLYVPRAPEGDVIDRAADQATPAVVPRDVESSSLQIGAGEKPAGYDVIAGIQTRSLISVPTPSQGLVSLVFGVWAFISFIFLIRVGRGWFALREIKRQSRPIQETHQNRVEKWAETSQKMRSVHIAVSDTLQTPIAAGLTKPTILVPTRLLGELSDEELNQVMLHEMAHLQRWDDWTNMLQKLAQAIFFFHPAIFWLGRRLDDEREMACDDWVVSLTSQPRVYAASLAKLVALDLHTRQYHVAQAMTQKKNQLFERVQILLNRQRHVKATFATRSVFTTTGILLTVVCLMAFTFPVMILSEPTTVVEEDNDRTELLRTLPVSKPSQSNGDASQSFSQPHVTPEPAPAEMEQSEAPEERAEYESKVPSAQQFESLPGVVPSIIELKLADTALPYTVEKSQVRGISKRSVIKTLRAAKTISSSGDRTRFLMQAVNRLPGDEDVYMAYIEAAATIPSSSDRERALGALLSGYRLGEASSIAFLKAAAGISSSGDKSKLLIRAIDHLSDETMVQDAFLEAVETISSRSDYGRVLTVFMEAFRK